MRMPTWWTGSSCGWGRASRDGWRNTASRWPWRVNASQDPRFQLFKDLPEDRFEAFLSVPVMCRGRVVGVINLQNREPHEYSEREMMLISTIGFLVGAEIEMARLESENLHLSEKLETRKLVERAKGILQRELKITEEEAYLTIQRQSRQRRKSMKEVSEAIVLSEDVRRGDWRANSVRTDFRPGGLRIVDDAEETIVSRCVSISQ